MNRKTSVLGVLVVLSLIGRPSITIAHDTWVQTATNFVRPEDVVHIDLCLGNHGNDHRDFKLASKLSSLEGASLDVVGPGGVRTDLLPEMVDLGYAPKEGFWSGRFIAAQQGLHCVAHTLDKLHRTTRGIKSGKAYFLVADSLDQAPDLNAMSEGIGVCAKPLGHPLEIVLETHPVLALSPGKEIVVRLFFRGQPLADQKVSFVPRGATLAAELDPEFERMTDAQGRCRWTPKDGNFVLIVAHHSIPEEKGDGYDKISYSATLVLNVPQRCMCCE